jgi:hypothetical protein
MGKRGGLVMKRSLFFVLAAVFFATTAFAAGPIQYQWTGVVLEVKDDVLVVQKGKEKWEIGRDKDTKVTGGDIQVGSKITVYYTMKASSVEVKAEAQKGSPKKATPAKQ